MDNNTEFDSIEIQDQDEEEKYFDEDDDEDDMDNMSSQGARNTKDDSESEEDYNSFQVEEDIRPGLRESTCTDTLQIKEPSSSSSHMEMDLVKDCEDKLELKGGDIGQDQWLLDVHCVWMEREGM